MAVDVAEGSEWHIATTVQVSYLDEDVPRRFVPVDVAPFRSKEDLSVSIRMPGQVMAQVF